VRPSTILGIEPEDTWLAYQVDLATLMAVAGGSDARGDPRQSKPAGYASLRHFARKMKVPESGVW
jgi:hypothetical protein